MNYPSRLMMMRAKPKYLMLAEALDKQIQALGPQSLLPSEDVLAKRFGVSRVTVRRALGLLERNGLVSRERGRGTIVNPPKIIRRLGPFFRIEEDLQDQGIKFETRVVEYESGSNPPDFIRERLRLPPGASACSIWLARLVEDRIVCCDRRYFPPEFAARFEPSVAETKPVYEILAELAGMSITAVDWDSEVISSSPEVASVLRITPGGLIVSNTFTEYLENGLAIEAGTMSYRIDRFKFRSLGFPQTNRSAVLMGDSPHGVVSP